MLFLKNQLPNIHRVFTIEKFKFKYYPNRKCQKQITFNDSCLEARWRKRGVLNFHIGICGAIKQNESEIFCFLAFSIGVLFYLSFNFSVVKTLWILGNWFLRNSILSDCKNLYQIFWEKQLCNFPSETCSLLWQLFLHLAV